MRKSSEFVTSVPIITLYSEEAEYLNNPADFMTIRLNQTLLKEKKKQLAITAAEAHSALLTGVQISNPKNMFVINSKGSEHKKWIDQTYAD